MSEKITLVTGANRGIGFETVRQLLKLDMKVILTARDEKKGKAAYEKLKNDDQNNSLFFRQLDVTDEKSIDKCYDYIEKEFGNLDILVNNAGILIDREKSGLDVTIDEMRKTMETNVYGPLMIAQKFIPLMKKNSYGRIINVSSGAGQLINMASYFPAYSMSKTTLNALTRLLADEVKNYNILVNSVCPGWVRTDMGGPDAERTVEKGAETIIWLATLPDNGPNGSFFRDKKQIEW